MSTRTKHIIGVVLTVATAVAGFVFGPSGPWAGIAAGGMVIGLLTQVQKALGSSW